MVKVIKKEDLPSTVNSWGFSGSTNKVKHYLSNGDVVVTGIAHYRHLKSEKWANVMPAKYASVDGAGERWNGSYHSEGVKEVSSLNYYLKKLNK